MNEQEMCVLLKHAKGRGTWQQLADRLEVTPAYIHAVLNGSRPFSDELARKLGYQRVQRIEFLPLPETAAADECA